MTEPTLSRTSVAIGAGEGKGTMDDVDACEITPLASWSLDERSWLLVQLNLVVARTTDDLAIKGRVDLIEPLHTLETLLRVVSTEIAISDGFGEVVASVAQLIRTVRNVRRTRTGCGTFTSVWGH